MQVADQEMGTQGSRRIVNVDCRVGSRFDLRNPGRPRLHRAVESAAGEWMKNV